MHLFENAWLIESLNQLKYIIYEVKHALFYSECLLDIWILQNRLIFFILCYLKHIPMKWSLIIHLIFIMFLYTLKLIDAQIIP